MGDLAKLISTRGRIKSRLTKFSSFLEKATAEVNKRIELPSRIGKAEELWHEFDKIQNEIEELDESDEQAGERELFEDSYHAAISLAKSLLPTVNPAPVNNQGAQAVVQQVQPAQAQPAQINVKLPNIELPKFDGSYDNWISFRDVFKSLIDNNPSLSAVQRLHYLKSSVTGEAANIIKSVELSNDNYNIAWNLLEKRYENKKLIVQHHIQLLLDFPVINKESYSSLRQLVDDISRHTQTLTKLGQPVNTWNTILIHLLLPKIDKASRREWELMRSTIEAFPALQEFIKFLQERSTFLESLAHSNTLTLNVHNDQKTNSKPSKQIKGVSHTYVSSVESQCGFCSGNHKLLDCTTFRNLPAETKIPALKEKRICIKCLKNYHGRNCKVSGCKKCGGYHHVLLHIDKPCNNETPNNISKLNSNSATACVPSNENPASSEQTNNHVPFSSLNHCATIGVSQVLLSTAIIIVYDRAGVPHECRALLDSGSQSNFITNELSEKLKLKRERVNNTILSISEIPLQTNYQVEATIQSRFNAFKANLSFTTIDKITGNLPVVRINVQHMKIPPNIKLADPLYHMPKSIDLLLGASIFWDLLCVGQIKLSNSQPTFQKTHLGWVISGTLHLNSPSNNNLKSYCYFTSNSNIDAQLERFWSVEEVENPIHFSNEHIQCEEHFKNTHTRDEEGRFIVKLPLKGNPMELGDSRPAAERRLQAVEKKLKNQPELRNQYHEFIKEYIQLGHMSEINELNDSTMTRYYLPHHAVIKESSTTTRLRVVFDASCATTSGNSLNNLLMVSPTIQDELFSIILRFRQHKYVLTADIAKMYRQIIVDQEHRNLQCILWRWNTEENIRIFQLNTVTYGMSSSPFMAIRCLHELAKEGQSSFPEASEVVSRDFYVDDLLTGANELSTLRNLKNDIIHILEKGKFELRKWHSNSPECSNTDQEDSHVNIGETANALGLRWNTSTDALEYRTNLGIGNIRPTKRGILSSIAQIYDPLGLLGPIVVQSKMLLQKLWQLKTSWDESLPIEIYSLWTRLIEKMRHINSITIPRGSICDNPIEIEVHGFCDASENAYGACVYLRSYSMEGQYTVQLLCAKSRVAPLKKLSLPRLELCGAVLLAKLGKKVIDSLTIKINNVYYWSDSQITLAWIAGEAYQWVTFVANRVSEIQRLSDRVQWHHVRSVDNPADLISRGVDPDKLQTASIWWHGPDFLQRHVSLSPFKLEDVMIPIPESRKTTLMVCTNSSPELGMDIIKKFSSLSRLKRVIAYCRRFRTNALSQYESQKGELSVQELDDALFTIIRIVQSHEFPTELQQLQSQSQVLSKSKLVNLHPFLDSQGLIRVGGRLDHAPIDYSRKHPIILPAKNHFTELIIRDTHYRQLHAGSEAVLATIRTGYWPLTGRQSVRRVLRKCIVCFRSRPVSMEPLMGHLPSARVTQSKPFLNTGVDYAGPFNIKISRNVTGKAYLCIFVCFATKAVHLELVSDLTTYGFLNALKRFLARRGRCTNLYSDNGTNFVGANNVLQELRSFLCHDNTQGQIKAYLNENFINWHFNPPYSPHMGGLWEAAVKSAKTHMRRVIGSTLLSFEEMYTVFVQIEACMNSRPLTPISSDPADLTVLTPGHFIVGESLMCLPEQDHTDIQLNRLSRYQLITQIKQHFWNRWSQEYISQLQQRHKWQRESSKPVLPGTMVLLKNENTPSFDWPLGRITEIHPGKDGETRLVTVRTTHGYTQRALTRICLLPTDDNPEK